VCVTWKIKCWILLMHGVTVKFVWEVFPRKLRPAVMSTSHETPCILCIYWTHIKKVLICFNIFLNSIFSYFLLIW